MEDYSSNLKKLYLFKFFKSFYLMSGILIPFFMVWGKISFFQIMALQSWYVIVEMLFEIPTGALADHIGRKKSVALGIFINILAVLTYVSKPDIVFFFVGESLWALSTAFINGADIALIYDSIKAEQKSKDSKISIANYNIFELIGIIIATPLGSFIAYAFGYQYAILLMCIPFFFALLIIMTIKEPAIKKNAKKSYTETLMQGISYFSKHKVLVILTFDSVSISILSFFMVWLYQPLLQELNIPVFYFGIVHATGALLQIIVLKSFMKIEEAFNSRSKYIFLSAFIIGFSFMLAAVSKSPILLAASIVSVMGFGFTRRVVFASYYNKHIETEHRATVLSTISMLSALGSASIYPIVGFLAQYSLSLTVFGIGITIILLSIFSKIEEDMLSD